MTKDNSAPETDGRSRDIVALRLALASTGFAAVVPVSTWLIGNSVLAVSIAAFGFAALGLVGANLNSVAGRICVAIGLIGQAICITAAFTGHPWQIDMHMLFFGFLAILMVMSEPAVIVAAVGLIAVHHLGLSILFPTLVYPSDDVILGLERTAIHALVVLVEGTVLWLAIKRRNAALKETQAAAESLRVSERETRAALERAEISSKEARAALEDAQDSQLRAQEAMRMAEEEAEKAQAADRDARVAEAKQATAREETQAALRVVISRLSAALEKLSQGDLTDEISNAFPEEYERLRQDYNLALLELQAAMTIVTQTTGTIVQDVHAIEEAANHLAQRTESQAANLQQTTAAIQQISDNAKRSADSASAAKSAVDQANERAAASDRIVGQTISAMSEIETSSQQITKIVAVIENIAFQTNLLALNAGVEAARAGEAGRGFSVVASEVRELAQRSSEAAREISTLIQASEKHVATGVTLVRDTGEALQNISDAVGNVSHHMGAITQSVEEQAISIHETKEAMQQLEAVTQQNAAMFEETNAVTQSLARQSDELQRSVARFRVGSAVSAAADSRRPASGLSPASGPATVSSAAHGHPTRTAAARKALPNEDQEGWEAF